MTVDEMREMVRESEARDRQTPRFYVADRDGGVVLDINAVSDYVQEWLEGCETADDTLTLKPFSASPEEFDALPTRTK